MPRYERELALPIRRPVHNENSVRPGGRALNWHENYFYVFLFRKKTRQSGKQSAKRTGTFIR